jgi:Xaa-Pro dipeptidase
MVSPDTAKLDRLRRLMAEARLDVLVCRLPENVLFLSGYYPVVGHAAVVFPLEGEPILVAPADDREFFGEHGWVTDVRQITGWDEVRGAPPEQIARHLRDIGAAAAFPKGRVGFEGSFEYVAPQALAAEPVVPALPARRALEAAFPDSELVDATELINRARAVKTGRDLELLRRANEVAAFGYQAWREACLNGATEAEAAAAFQAAVTARGIGYKGAYFAMAWPQVISGERTGGWPWPVPAGETAPLSYWPYRLTGTRRVGPGDFVLCEAAVCVDGYWTDLTRTFIVGTPTDRQQEVFSATERALRAAIAAARPGVKASEVDRAAREALGEYVRYFPHWVGHGLGLKYHEPYPRLNPLSEDILEPGMCFVVEPGIYIPDFGGVRNEQVLFVTERGVEVLSGAIPVAIG